MDCCFLYLYIEIQKTRVSVFHFSDCYVKKASLEQHICPLRSSTQERKNDIFLRLGEETVHAFSTLFWGNTYPQETHIVHNSFLVWYLKAWFLKGGSLWCTLPSVEQISLSHSWISVIMSIWLTNIVIFSRIISLINNNSDYFYLNLSDSVSLFQLAQKKGL